MVEAEVEGLGEVAVWVWWVDYGNSSLFCIFLQFSLRGQRALIFRRGWWLAFCPNFGFSLAPRFDRRIPFFLLTCIFFLSYVWSRISEPPLGISFLIHSLYSFLARPYPELTGVSILPCIYLPPLHTSRKTGNARN